MNSHDMSGSNFQGSSWPQDGGRFGAIRTCKTFGVAYTVACGFNFFFFQQFQEIFQEMFQDVHHFSTVSTDVLPSKSMCRGSCPLRILAVELWIQIIQGQLDGWREILQVHRSPNFPTLKKLLSHAFSDFIWLILDQS